MTKTKARSGQAWPVRRGTVITPRRARLIWAYEKRHSWVHHWPGDGRGPPYTQWTDNERCAYEAWKEGFFVEELDQGQATRPNEKRHKRLPKEA
jgi:hypothetical protein